MNIRFGGLLKKHCWWDFKLVVLSTVCRKTHACSINGSTMTQVNLAIFTRSLHDHQIKITVNISAYTVAYDGRKFLFQKRIFGLRSLRK